MTKNCYKCQYIKIEWSAFEKDIMCTKRATEIDFKNAYCNQFKPRGIWKLFDRLGWLK